MKKLALVLALAATLAISTAAVAAPQEAAYAQDPAVQVCVERMEAQKEYLKSMLDGELITQEIYDVYAANIDAKIDYILENGVGSACGNGGMGGGCGRGAMAGGACGNGGMGGGACGMY